MLELLLRRSADSRKRSPCPTSRPSPRTPAGRRPARPGRAPPRLARVPATGPRRLPRIRRSGASRRGTGRSSAGPRRAAGVPHRRPRPANPACPRPRRPGPVPGGPLPGRAEGAGRADRENRAPADGRPAPPAPHAPPPLLRLPMSARGPVEPLAPNAAMRSAVTATAGPDQELADRLDDAADKMGITGEEGPRRSNARWAMLIARIHESLPLQCTRCPLPAGAAIRQRAAADRDGMGGRRRRVGRGRGRLRPNLLAMMQGDVPRIGVRARRRGVWRSALAPRGWTASRALRISHGAHVVPGSRLTSGQGDLRGISGASCWPVSSKGYFSEVL